MLSFIAATVIASLAPQALANLYLTSPVASTTCQAGQPCNVAWNDDGQQPSLSQIGTCTVGIYVGSQTQQTLLQDLGPVDVSKQANAPFTAQAAIGPNGGDYFLRFTSTSFKDPANPQYPFQGFSAKFTLTGMTGQFNATIQQQIAGASAPAAASPSASVAASGASPSASGSAAASQTPSASPSKGASTTAKSSGTSAASSSPTSNSARVLASGSSSSMLIGVTAVVVSAVAAGFAL